MTKQGKWLVLFCVGVLTINTSWSQKAIPLEIVSTGAFKNNNPIELLQFADKKQLPSGYEMETLEALSHFPELKDVRIKFRICKSFSTLKTRPTFFSMFMPRGHRSYVITISNKSVAELKPIMFEHLSREARIGILGHEISHVVDFSSSSSWRCFRIAIGHMSPRFLDKFEYNTDMICIKHGLGKNLEAWSSYIRDTMHTVYWRGAGYVHKGDTRYERYMNPPTIEKNLPTDTTTHPALQAR